jgi:Tol biopolymer transport system component/predicted Ser/Thr protein kinase
MPLSPGTSLGPYQIDAPLGAGGMGEVYKATDTRLDRTVAIKVLPEHVAADPDLKQRFEREAKTISSLNHPHICTLHDIGNQDGIDFLVMEYLDGETLAQRLEKGALPLDQALTIATEIADALDKAHRQGIVHRDLKPGNIMLTKAGAKLLDFGLAKLRRPGTPRVESYSAATTQSAPLTERGVIVGTLPYMAPEQVEGKDSDARSDIFSFGAVVYELLTGQRAFRGETTARLISAIVADVPPAVSTHRPDAPPLLGRVLARCLEKDPDNRWQSAGDLQAALHWAKSDQPVSAAAPRSPGRLGVAATAAVVVVALLGVVLWPRESVLEREPITFTFGAPPDNRVVIDPPVPSPDGRRIAFVAAGALADTALWVRPLDGAARRIDGTEGARSPFWSPDGESLGFFADGALKLISPRGGPTRVLADAPSFASGTWSASGDIVFTPANRSPLMRVSASGGPARVITTLDEDRQENSHRYPQFLPDGRHFLFTARSSLPEDTAIYMGSLDSSEVRRILIAQSNAAYVSPDVLLFGRDDVLMAQRFDPDAFELGPEAVPVVGGVARNTASAITGFSASADGRVLAFMRADAPTTELRWFDRTGADLGTVGPPGVYRSPRLSPDGDRLTVEIADADTGNRDLWLFELPTGLPTRWTTNPANDWQAVWSPDGSAIAFASDRTPRSSIHIRTVDGDAPAELVVMPESYGAFPQSWAPNGRFLVYTVASGGQADLWLLPLGDDQDTHPLLATEFDEAQARVSPDNQWFAYTSDRSGSDEIYVRAVDGRVEQRVSADGGARALWRSDGTELFFMAPNGDLMVAEAMLGDSPGVATPTTLFRACTATSLFYTADADGERFLFVCPTADPSITVMDQWTSMVSWPDGDAPFE